VGVSTACGERVGSVVDRAGERQGVKSWRQVVCECVGLYQRLSVTNETEK
jgi:hypothetical protein